MSCCRRTSGDVKNDAGSQDPSARWAPARWRPAAPERLAAQKLPVVATQTRNLALAHKTEIDDERMPTTYADYSNHVLLMLSAHGDDQAIRERMVRDVMKVDGVEHTEAEKTVGEIEQAAKSGLAMSRLPYRVGIAAALVAGFGSIPMCFDLHTVLWFNEQYVTMDVEDAKNLETWLEVGSWVVELDGAAARPGELLPPLPPVFPGPDEEHRHADVHGARPFARTSAARSSSVALTARRWRGSWRTSSASSSVLRTIMDRLGERQRRGRTRTTGRRRVRTCPPHFGRWQVVFQTRPPHWQPLFQRPVTSVPAEMAPERMTWTHEPGMQQVWPARAWP